MRSFIYLLSILVLFAACGENTQTDSAESTNEAPPIDYKEKGRAITDAAFSRLSQNLMQAMKAGGVPHAIDYCQVEAYPITDSVSSDFEVSIRRTSSKYRNPSNQPTVYESALLQHYDNQTGEMMMRDSLITLEDGSMVYARPILLQEPCLNCHGQVGTDITEDNYTIIKEKYPKDKATGYSAGDFRGIWVVSF